MTLSEVLEEYVSKQGGDDFLRSWFARMVVDKPELIDDLLVEKMKKEITNDIKAGKGKNERPPKIGG